MKNIIIGRCENDPEAQGVIKPEDDSWQLVIDKDGYPHLYVRCKLEATRPDDPKTGLLAIDDVLPPEMQVRDLMQSIFGGAVEDPEEVAKCAEEWSKLHVDRGVPCPR